MFIVKEEEVRKFLHSLALFLSTCLGLVTYRLIRKSIVNVGQTYSERLLASLARFSKRSRLSTLARSTLATQACMQLIKAFSTAKGAVMTATILNNEKPKTRGRKEKQLIKQVRKISVVQNFFAFTKLTRIDIQRTLTLQGSSRQTSTLI